MRTVLSVTSVLAIAWMVLWRRIWLEEARRRDATRIRPIRFRKGWETFDQKLQERTARRRDAEERALTDFKRELRGGKPRLFKAS